MGRKKTEQKINDNISQLLTVEQLIEILQKFPPSAPVGVVGNFGEFYGYDKFDFSYSEGRETYITANGFWRDDNRRYINVVDVSQMNIPDPD